MPLAVVDAEGVGVETLGAGDGERRRAIESAAQEHDRTRHAGIVWRVRLLASVEPSGRRVLVF
jgi:hypothetical protein